MHNRRTAIGATLQPPPAHHNLLQEHRNRTLKIIVSFLLFSARVLEKPCRVNSHMSVRVHPPKVDQKNPNISDDHEDYQSI